MESPSPAVTPGTSLPGESTAQEQARLRRERRTAKIQAGGSDRLGKISSLSGRPLAAEAEFSRAPTTQDPHAPPQTMDGHSADDPAEIDISSMFQRPRDDSSMQSQQDILRQMLAGAGPSENGGTPRGQESEIEDPMMRMMQQLMGGAGGPGGEGNGAIPPGFPPGLASLFGGQQQPEPATNANYIWKIVHAVFALVLGLYVTTSFTFSGSKLARAAISVDDLAPKLFWIFATAELMLQSSRYYLDGGKLPASGILGGLGMMLPEPYANYVRIFSRYSIIYTTVVSDATVIIFVLGCMAWWKGLAGA